MLSIIPRPRPASETALNLDALAYIVANLAPELWVPADDDAAHRDAARDILDELLHEFDAEAVAA
ncbi:hypothetical protein IMZ11_41975 [Microtetraspora sp. AC03309]|uniref:hypothetical protein n=1 Tax=Microtetraspora sp. AC03309 TaxID=2779376 RepID=UPI001E4EECB6|nr:hypothetical protein [Microtetraspora sp. AC03309]MCC5582179.1 hypothetical protein [Microtetraspora sp. AC03309]